ncbi:[Pyruvate dehydrogenase [acetyl-transferring]]-phosphatase 1, mitochondrial [Xanthoria parietina]
MYLRQFSAAAIVSIVASSLWYYRKEPDQKRELAGSPTTARGLPHLNPAVANGQSQSRPVVEDDRFFVQEVASSGPIIKSAEVQSVSPHAMLNPEEATQKLRHLQESYEVLRGRGVLRYDIVQLPSNNPIEDDHVEKLMETSPSVPLHDQTDSSATSDWMFWSVFDGHSGWTTSAKLRQVLTSYVARELDATYKHTIAASSLLPPSAALVDAAIKQGFLKCDHDIVHESINRAKKANTKSAAADILGPALSGSCALLSFYDSRSKDFRVACTGDSRAVLGRLNPNGTWTAQPLSEDQTGGTPSEMARLRAEHPGEPNVVAHGRILGNLEPSRAFGDAHYKWARDIQDMVKKDWFGRSPLTLLKTPPYVTAEPVVTTTRVMPEKGDFVVLATDGLWEMLTNDEVVGLVGRWLEENPLKSKTTPSASPSWTRSFLGGKARSDASLPVNRLHNESSQSGQRSPIRRQQWDITAGDERFVVEDKNAATHLVRNALGGRDRDMVCGLLTLPSPYSRRYRDDLTVEVIFFGEAEPCGDVVLNVEASAPRIARPKL